MTAYDALTAILELLESSAAYDAPGQTLNKIARIVDRHQPQPFTATLPTQPGWYVHKADPDGESEVLRLVLHKGRLSYHTDHPDAWIVDGWIAIEDLMPVGLWKGPLDLEAL